MIINEEYLISLYVHDFLIVTIFRELNKGREYKLRNLNVIYGLCYSMTVDFHE